MQSNAVIWNVCTGKQSFLKIFRKFPEDYNISGNIPAHNHNSSAAMLICALSY